MVSNRSVATTPTIAILTDATNATPSQLVPSGMRAVRVRNGYELVAHLEAQRIDCVIVDAAALGGATAVLEAVGLARAKGVSCCVVDAPAAIAVDCPTFKRQSWRALIAWVRYTLGEPTREAARIPYCGSGRLHDSAPPRHVQVLDLSESGVSLEGEALPVSTATLHLSLPDGLELAVAIEHVRALEGTPARAQQAAYRFSDLQPAQRAALRTFVLRRREGAARSLRAAPAPTAEVARAPHIVGKSELLARTLARITKVAPTDETVLILGETGTGKELAAHALHERSHRCNGPLVAVNCAALPPDLVESELFGHEAGAFTGAVKRKIGRIERASNGTLFLDEIGELPPPAQAKLLRALQEQVIDRVGGTEPIRVNVRLIAATNRNLTASVAASSFRRDLFFRLNVVSISLPPLRDRTEDIPLLVAHFLAAAERRMHKREIRLHERALEKLMVYHWPGNIRELENACTRLVALADDGDLIAAEDIDLLPERPAPVSNLASTGLRDVLEFCECEILRRVLDKNGGNRTKTAQALGISRQALQQKLTRFRSSAQRRIDDGVGAE